jgi:hypothetical protein
MLFKDSMGYALQLSRTVSFGCGLALLPFAG